MLSKKKNTSPNIENLKSIINKKSNYNIEDIEFE